MQYSWENNRWFGWRFESTTNGHLKATSLNAFSRVISVVGASTAAAANCHLYDYNPSNGGDQKLRIVPKTNGLFKFRFVHSNMAWDIPGGNNANLTPLQQYPDNTNVWQEFQLERLVSMASPNALNRPSVSIDRGSTIVNLRWLSQAGYLYQPYWSSDLKTWFKLTPSALSGTGSLLNVTDSQMPQRCFYRLFISPGS